MLSREVTEFDEFTGRLEAVNTVAVRPRVSGYVSSVRFREGAIVKRGDLLLQIDPRPFQAEVDRLRAELVRARATVSRAGSELQRAERLSTENAMSHEEKERRASFAAETAAQVAAVEAGLRAAELNLEFTRVIAPIDGRVGRAIVTEGNLVSSGPGEATLLTTLVSLDPIYASFEADEQTFLRYGNLTRDGKRASARSAMPIHMALANDQEFPREGEMNFLDNQIDPATGTIRGRATFRNKDGDLTPGLFVRLQPARQRLVSGPADSGPRGRHRSRQALRPHRRRRSQGAVSRRHPWPARRWPARRAHRLEARRTGGREWPAARAPRHAGGIRAGGDGSDRSEPQAGAAPNARAEQ